MNQDKIMNEIAVAIVKERFSEERHLRHCQHDCCCGLDNAIEAEEDNVYNELEDLADFDLSGKEFKISLINNWNNRYPEEPVRGV